VRPTTLVQMLDTIKTTKEPTTRIEVWKGREVEAVTYAPNADNIQDFTLYYPKGFRDTDMFRLASYLYSYAEEINIHDSLNEPIVFNDFLTWLGFTLDKDNAHGNNTKKSVWQALHMVYKTELRAKFDYVIKNTSKTHKTETYIFDNKPVIETLIGVYTKNGRDIEAKDYEETPPDKMIVKFVDFFITQLKGVKLSSGEWIPRNVTFTPKISASLWNNRYQGSRMDLLEYIFLELKKMIPISGIRHFNVNDLLTRGSQINRKSMAVDKLMEHLDIYMQDGIIKDWGFKASNKGKPLAKQYKKMPLVWIDFSGTETFEEILKLSQGVRRNIKLERLEQEVKDTNSRIGNLEKFNKKWADTSLK
jgi:hypothetical protein